MLGYIKDMFGEEPTGRFDRAHRDTVFDSLNWPDRELVEPIWQLINARFGAHPRLAALVANSVSLIRPCDMASLQRILDESEATWFDRLDPDLYQGKGWNPNTALHFLDQSARFRLFYQAVGPEEWVTHAEPLGGFDEGRATQPGYTVSGRYGCARRLRLEASFSEPATPTQRERFTHSALALVAGACPTADTQALSRAIDAQWPLSMDVGAISLRLHWRPVVATGPGRGQRSIILTLQYGSG